MTRWTAGTIVGLAGAAVAALVASPNAQATAGAFFDVAPRRESDPLASPELSSRRRARGASALGVRRWPARVRSPIRVWIAAADSLAGWSPRYAARARDAFATWERAGIPVRFAFVADSARAEVRVRWTNRLPRRRAGVTRWTVDARGRMRAAEVTLALHASDGVTPLGEVGIAAVALHEVGHVLGLRHSRDRRDAMAAWVSVTSPSDSDRARVRLLHAGPPGIAE